MKKAMFCLGFWGILGLLLASDEPANFSGTWMLDTKKSYVIGRALDENEKAPLVIAQTENEIQISVNKSGRRLGYEGFRLDGEKAVIPGPKGSEITIKAKLKVNKFEVETENRYSGKISKTWRKYSLSKDGKTLKWESPGRTLVYKKVDAMPGSASQPVSLSPQAATLKPESYAARALEWVKSQRSVDGLQLEIVGKPALKPETFRWKMAPDAIVLVNLNSGAIVQDQALVMFSNNRPAGTLFSHRKASFSEGNLDRTELQQVEKELVSFFATAMDVSRGSERFYPYLPDDIRSMLKHPDRKFRLYMPPGAVDPSWREKLAQNRAATHALDGLNGWNEKLSDDELRRFVALQLDVVVQELVLLFRGFEKEAIGQANRWSSQELVSNPRESIKSLEESVVQNKSLLEKAGILSPEHLSMASSYLKLMVSQGFVIKEVPTPEPCPCFLSTPADATLYVTSLTSLTLHFTRMGGTLRIVCAALP